MSQILPPKKDVALALLERASVFVHLDPRGAGVVVPVHFKRQPRLVLQIGLNMAVPIPDLRLDDQGLSCTLSFNRSLFHCVVPWSGIFALVGEDGRGMVWPEDVPQEIAREMSPQKDEGKDEPKPQGATGPSAGGLTGVAGGRKRPHVSLVASGGVRADSKRPSKRAAGSKRKRDDADKPTLFKVPAVDSSGAPSDAPAKPKTGKPGQPSQQPSHLSDPRGQRGQLGKRPSGKAAEKRTEEKRADDRPSEDKSGNHGSGKGASKPAEPSQPGHGAGPSTNPGAGPGSPSSSPPGKRSPKRELPPYLRVVK